VYFFQIFYNPFFFLAIDIPVSGVGAAGGG
jgi:hypothetical protein